MLPPLFSPDFLQMQMMQRRFASFFVHFVPPLAACLLRCCVALQPGSTQPSQPSRRYRSSAETVARARETSIACVAFRVVLEYPSVGNDTNTMPTLNLTQEGADGDVEMKDATVAAASTAAPSSNNTGSPAKPRLHSPSLNGSPAGTSGRQPIVYRWVGPGVSDRSDPKSGATVYTQLEMRVGGRAALIRTGDCALLCSGDVTEDVLYGGTPTAKGGGDDDANMADAADSKKADDQEADLLYGGAATCFDDVAISQLDPFVARIERMWEEPEPAEDGADESPAAARRREQDRKLFGTNYDERRARMKIRARWFYKVSEGLAVMLEGAKQLVWHLYAKTMICFAPIAIF